MSKGTTHDFLETSSFREGLRWAYIPEIHDVLLCLEPDYMAYT